LQVDHASIAGHRRKQRRLTLRQEVMVAGDENLRPVRQPRKLNQLLGCFDNTTHHRQIACVNEHIAVGNVDAIETVVGVADAD